MISKDNKIKYDTHHWDDGKLSKAGILSYLSKLYTKLDVMDQLKVENR